MTEWVQDQLPFDGELPPSTNLEMKAYVGCVVLIAVGGCHPNMRTQWQPEGKAVVRGSMVVLNGPQAGDELVDVLFFNSRVVRTLRGLAGKAKVAHVDLDRSFSNPAPILLEPTDEEFEYARKWHAANPNRTQELIEISVAAFDSAESGQGQQQQQRPQQQAQTRSAPPSSPPTGPNYGRTPPPSSPPPTSPPSGDAPPPTRSATLESLRGHDEPPF